MTLQNNAVTGAAQSVKVNHPTGLTGVVAAGAVIVAKKAGVDLTVEEAAILIGAVIALASALSPRFRSIAREQTADNVPPAGDTGPG